MPREAGRDLDALVALRVLGYAGFYPDGRGVEQWPAYSTDIGAAWEVVERVHSLDECHLLCLMRSIRGSWNASFLFGGPSHTADTAPLAVCLAALAAFDTEPPLPVQPSVPRSSQGGQ